ncbi:MAG TPA: hypothetical protein ENJ09_09910 [Planctomycetes bacterium]|nr:hypothetical protein [Planctomycetota bacterium]
MKLPQLRATALLAGFLLPSASLHAQAQSSARARVAELPVLFVDANGDGTFRARIPGLSLEVHRDGWEVAGERVVRMRIDGGDAIEVRGEDPAATRVNVLRSAEEASRARLAFGRVRAEAVLPGVDLVFGARAGRPEYDLELAAGVDASAVRFHFEGADAVRLTPEGSLVISLGEREVTQCAPESFELTASGERRALRSRFVSFGNGSFGYEVEERAPNSRLLIDPVLVYSQMVGGSNADEATAVAVDADGGTYVAGWVRSADFPGTSEAAKGRDVVVFKFGADSQDLEYVTLVGGSSDEEAADIAVDDAGRATVVGWTRSKDFPTNRGAIQGLRSGGSDGFAFRLAPDGASLEWSTYLGGRADDAAEAVALSDVGTTFLTGTTSSKDFPVTSQAFQTEPAGARDAFVTQIGSEGKVIVYSTLLGGMRDDHGRDVALDGNGNAYVVGKTDSVDFPTTTGALDLRKSDLDGFVTKLSLSGAALSFSTFLGWNGQDEALSIAIDARQEPWVAGWTQADDLPATPDAMQRYGAGHRDGFVVRLSPSGGSLRYATYLGGEGADEVRSVALDAFGSPWFAGFTDSDQFPVTPDAAQESRGGGRDAFLVGIDEATGSLAFGTYLGSGGHEEGRSVATQPFTGAIALAGSAMDVAPDDRGRLGGSKWGPADAMVARFEPILCGRPAAKELLGGPAGVVLAATPPRLGKPFRVSIQAGPPAAPGYVLLGTAGAASSLLEGFAELHLDPTRMRVLYSFVTDADGNWQTETVLPRRSALCGNSVVLQAVVLDRTSGPLSFGALSEGIELTLGD